MVACAVPADKIAESVRAYPTTYPPAIGVVSNQGSFQRVPSAVLGGPQERVQGGMQGGVQAGLQGGVQAGLQGGPPLARVQGGGVQDAPRAVVTDAHVEAAKLQDYRSKLQQYKAQLQTLHTQETQEGTQGGLQEGPPGESPGEAQSDSSVASIEVVALEGVPTAALQGVPTAVARLVAASAVADAQAHAQLYISKAGSSLTEAPKGDSAASADELGRRDLASSPEVWEACQDADAEGDDNDGDGGGGDDGGADGGDGDGVAADLIDLARGSTAGTIVDVSIVVDVDVVDDDEAALTEEPQPMTEGGVLEACSACTLRILPTRRTQLATLICTTVSSTLHHSPPRPHQLRITSLPLQVLHLAYRHVNSTLHTLLEGDNLCGSMLKALSWLKSWLRHSEPVSPRALPTP